MRTYPVFVAGQPEPGRGWVYTAHAAALIADPLTVGRETLRRERGQDGQLPDELIAGRVALSTSDQIDRAITAARAAQAGWAAVPFSQRLRLAEALYERLQDCAEELTAILVAEGHPVALARWELSGMLACVHPKTVRAAADLWQAGYEASGRRIRMQYQPDGVVAISPPQNASASNSLLGVWSLVAGNSLVVGAPRSSPLGVAFLYQDLVAPALTEAGAPQGVLSVLCELTKTTLRAWLDSPNIDSIFYFGSSVRGKALAAECYARDKKPVLELSGNDGVLVWEDADIRLAARALAEAFLGSGQICMLPRYAIVHPAIADELLAEVCAHAAAMKPGLPNDPEVVLSPVFKAPQFRSCLRQFTEAGARVVTGAHTMTYLGTPDPSGMFIAPTIVRADGWQIARSIPAIHEETFFPLLKVVVPEVGPSLLGEAVEFLNANPYGLRNSLWASDPEVIRAFTGGVRNAGILKVNDSHAGFAAIAPTHGGTGRTGGPHGGAAIPLLRSARLQTVCDATGLGEAADLEGSVAALVSLSLNGPRHEGRAA